MREHHVVALAQDREWDDVATGSILDQVQAGAIVAEGATPRSASSAGC